MTSLRTPSVLLSDFFASDSEKTLTFTKEMIEDFGSDWTGSAGPRIELNVLEGFLEVPVTDVEGDVTITKTGQTKEQYAKKKGWAEAPAPMTPVKGYRPQSPEALALVNQFKVDEERLLRKLEELVKIPRSDQVLRPGTADGDVNAVLPPMGDPRMVAIGKTKLQEAFMWINRAVFQPGRVALPEDDGK